MDYSLLHSSVHGILQARILEWVTIPFSRGSSRPREQAFSQRKVKSSGSQSVFSGQAAVAPGDLLEMQGLGFHLDLLIRRSGVGEMAI